MKLLGLQPEEVPRLMIKTLDKYEVIQALFQTAPGADNSPGIEFDGPGNPR